MVGRSLLRDDLLLSVKASPTSPYRDHPYQASSNDVNWAGTRYLYEAVHGPVYYALMVPVYWASEPFGIEHQLLAVRLATVLPALVAVPGTTPGGSR